VASIETSIVINRPIGEVFALVSDAENSPRWASQSVTYRKTATGPLGVGTTYRIVNSVMGWPVESNIVVTEYEPNQRYTIASTGGPFRFVARHIFEAVEGGTRIHLTSQAEVSGLFRLVAPLVISLTRRQVRANYRNLKRLMEAADV
jgi:uncharacterized protein YndB with AHSA1/START domain